MDQAQFDRLESLLERIASALERQPGGHGGGGGGGGNGQDRCTKLPDGRFKWEITPDKKVSHCRKCNAEIFWVKTKNHKNLPINPDGFSHFDTCGGSGNPISTSSPPEEDSSEVPF
jgi:hypothetical protein